MPALFAIVHASVAAVWQGGGRSCLNACMQPLFAYAAADEDGKQANDRPSLRLCRVGSAASGRADAVAAATAARRCMHAGGCVSSCAAG